MGHGPTPNRPSGPPSLVRMAEALEARATELRELIVAETGSVGFLTDYIQAAGSIGMFRSNAAQIEHVIDWIESGAPTGGAGAMAGSALFREPVGVVGAITPFNFPFMLNVVKVAPALAAGCTVVLKPHPWTPLDAFLIAQAAEEAGIPPGVLNVITGHGEVGDEMTTNAMVDMVAFTGSTATGRRIMANGAGTMKRLQLELGGKSAQVVLDDVSEDYARSIGFGSGLDPLWSRLRPDHPPPPPRALARCLQRGRGRGRSDHHHWGPARPRNRARTLDPRATARTSGGLRCLGHRTRSSSS